MNKVEQKQRTFTMIKIIENSSFDQERSLYALRHATVKNCVFAGEADGESALKECSDVTVEDCSFSLRYPLWHANRFELVSSSMDTLTRAPLWYSDNGKIENCEINGTKAVRECNDITIKDSKINSEEFGWRCSELMLSDSEFQSVYFLFEAKNVEINNIRMGGKYSFQYTENVSIKNSVLDTKDAFWHGKNIVVENSTLKGEYLAWFSDGLTLINCHISGTQPFCYCKNLKLINCTMESTDLSFEYSDVEADINGNIMSVKNPRSGYIKADSIGEIILENSVMETTCKIETK